MPRDLGIYIHWPFCVSKCPYCDFFSKAEKSQEVYKFAEDRLLEDLRTSMIEISEIDTTKVMSLFFGGGTPSLMSAKSIQDIIDFLCKNYSMEDDIEITLEANPGTFDLQKLCNFRSAGINRLSLGVQSFSSQALVFLGRSYDSERAVQAIGAVADTFENFSVDLMYGYECQSVDALEDDMRKTIAYGCKHLSCYQLTIEESTPFHERFLAGELLKLSDAQESYFYNFIKSFLESYDFRRYEVSNYAMDGYESKHNMGYWRYNDYLGIGPGAHSRITIDEKKHEISWECNVNVWLDSSENQIQKKALTDIELLQEMVLTGLRTVEGIQIEKLQERVPEKIYTEIFAPKKMKLLRENNLIIESDTLLKLSDSGFLRLNSVVAFLFD